DPHLAHGQHAGGEVDNHRLGTCARKSGSEWIGAQTRLGAAEGCDIWPRHHIHKMNRYEPRSRALLCPMADAADVVTVAQSDDGAAVGPGALDTDLHGAMPGHLTNASLCIKNDHAAHVGDPLELGRQRHAPDSKAL